MAKDEIGGVWRTVGGRRIFIKDGEDLYTAMKKSGKFKSSKESLNEEGKKLLEQHLKKLSPEELTKLLENENILIIYSL